MMSNWMDRGKSLSLVWPVALLALGLWCWLAAATSAPALMAAVGFTGTGLLGMGWWSRARASRRLRAALDVYAEQEIARTRPRKMPRRRAADSTRRGVLAG
jgi:hypothetical protein